MGFCKYSVKTSGFSYIRNFSNHFSNHQIITVYLVQQNYVFTCQISKLGSNMLMRDIKLLYYPHRLCIIAVQQHPRTCYIHTYYFNTDIQNKQGLMDRFLFHNVIIRPNETSVPWSTTFSVPHRNKFLVFTPTGTFQCLSQSHHMFLLWTATSVVQRSGDLLGARSGSNNGSARHSQQSAQKLMWAFWMHSSHTMELEWRKLLQMW